MTSQAAVGSPGRAPVEPAAPEGRPIERVQREAGSPLDAFLHEPNAVEERGMPSGQVDRNRNHYPGDRAVNIFTLGNMGEEATRRFVRLRSRTRRVVRGSVPLPKEWYPRYRASAKFTSPILGANELKAFAIDGACRLMRDAQQTQGSPWMELLQATRRRECPDIPAPLPIPIDGVRDARMEPDIYRGYQEFRCVMHSPSIQDFNERRAAYVSEVSVGIPMPIGYEAPMHASFSLLVFVDDFEIDFQTEPLMAARIVRNVRNVRIPQDPRRSFSWRPSSETEMEALESLREMISEEEFRRYLKRGFISVKGGSGRDYQIFRDRWHAKVRVKGKVVAEICSRIRDNRVPMTDNVIAFKTMIEADEAEFERAGNVYRMTA